MKWRSFEKGLTSPLPHEVYQQKKFSLRSNQLSMVHQDIIRSEICSNLKEAHLPRKQNFTREDRKACNALKEDESIFVIKANKGHCTVAMNKTGYNNQIREMFQDRDVYQPVTDKRRTQPQEFKQR